MPAWRLIPSGISPKVSEDGKTPYREYIDTVESDVVDYYTKLWLPSSQSVPEALAQMVDQEDEFPDEIPAPPELRLLWSVETYHTLPWSGGLYDQPEQLMDILDSCIRGRRQVQLTVAANDRLKNKAENAEHNHS